MPWPNPRIPYEMTSERKRLRPLDGKSLIVHVVLNVEYWPFDGQMPRAVIPAPHGRSPVPDIGNYGWVEYGMRAGMPRIMRLLAEREIKASAFMNAYCADVYPQCAEAMLEAGWEFVGHCWIQRSLNAEDDEREIIEKSAERLELLTGKKTRGWLGAGIGETFHTPDILKECGIDWLADFCVDDLPVWIRTKHGPLIGMPYTMEINDVPIWAVQQQSSDEMFRRVEATVSVLERELDDNPRVLTIALHPHLVGVPHRAYWLAKTLDLLLDRDDTIFVTGSDIADWFRAADGTDGQEVMDADADEVGWSHLLEIRT
ncbi:MAG: polysaccharide deacetylase family protein [Methyloligellaceae bacterium]